MADSTVQCKCILQFMGFNRKIRGQNYVLRSQVLSPFLQWQTGTECIYTDSDNRDVWVNHDQQSGYDQAATLGAEKTNAEVSKPAVQLMAT